MYLLACSACKKRDIEMFPKGSLIASYEQIVKKLGRVCGCRKTYKYCEEQYTILAKRTLTGTGWTFGGFEGKFTGDSSKVRLYRESDKITIYLTLRKILRSAKDSKVEIYNKPEPSIFGYYPLRADWDDYLYIIKFNNQYLKIGRSFDVDRRVKELSRKSKVPIEKIEILNIFKGTHAKVYELEQELHQAVNYAYHFDSTWTVESFNLDCYSIVLSNVDTSKFLPQT